MSTHVEIKCSCGSYLNIHYVDCDIAGNIVMHAEPCQNKKCDKGFCGDCEDMKELETLREEHRQLVQQSNKVET